MLHKNHMFRGVWLLTVAAAKFLGFHNGAHFDRYPRETQQNMKT